ncbi:Fic family protein [Treponema zuelzerae]|uniref:Fic family protein n=1 Tax=Teretinema zuelzerae TaxID=156 RepID=A0AAE3JIQ9_9SPIR|nr:Fic family protein [Teretinema zuelzerae]MCD1655512.1 Fic family protein [Teretinema zuelzerae]
MGNYVPPFKITAKSITLIAEISAQLERYAIRMEQSDSLRLRKANRIKTIQGSLAIEGNTLSEEQITAILEGKHVIAPLREVQEVRNAIDTYDRFTNWDPYSEKDLLAAHGCMMKGLIDEVGQFRHGGVGVIAGTEVIHLAPPADRVPFLVNDLLSWLKQSEDHPLVKSSVFHYEFEFIHPFADGNGRMGRLWQTLILSTWKPVFAHVPIENLVYAHQAEYYQAIGDSTEKTDAGIFVEFLLGAILEALQAQHAVTPEVSHEVTPEVERLIKVFKKGEELTRKELQERLGLKDEKNFRQKYLLPALAGGYVDMTVPDKPNSRLQKYKKSNP